MERLTDDTNYCTSWADCEFQDGNCKLSKNCYERKMYEKLKAYEDAEEQGLMAQNPYKPGELIFCVEEYVDGYDYSGYIFVASCNDFVISSSSYIHCNSFDEQLMEMCEESQEECGVSFYMFRKDRVFATKEEAEAALAEMNKKENINE